MRTFRINIELEIIENGILVTTGRSKRFCKDEQYLIEFLNREIPQWLKRNKL